MRECVRCVVCVCVVCGWVGGGGAGGSESRLGGAFPRRDGPGDPDGCVRCAAGRQDAATQLYNLIRYNYIIRCIYTYRASGARRAHRGAPRRDYIIFFDIIISYAVFIRIERQAGASRGASSRDRARCADAEDIANRVDAEDVTDDVTVRTGPCGLRGRGGYWTRMM